MNTYESLLKHGKAQLNTNQNGEELICFYPNQLKKAIEITQFNAQLHPLRKPDLTLKSLCKAIDWKNVVFATQLIAIISSILFVCFLITQVKYL